ncbi:glycosyltransferase, partial [Rhodopseudomonas sp. BAL398]|uniref:glycosyltransferase n=1 Tax=Rhodopseudomonas sp. BAL398 TaxID=3034676 RepID=UPI0023E27D78
PRPSRGPQPPPHRRLRARVQNTRVYFSANPRHVNYPGCGAGRDEISARFYEGAAAGTVMLGEAPRIDEFKRQFDWPDAVIHLPFDSPDIGQILAELNGNPGRLRAVMRENARQAALRHDWLYRIQTVFEIMGLAPTEQMQIRAQRLAEIASRV